MRKTIVTAGVLSLAAAGAAFGAAESWPRYRGPASSSPGLPDGGLTVEWKRELGTGYSSIVVAGDKAVTMFGAAGEDVLAAFDVASGKELWRYRLGDMYPAHDGGDGGPVSTPTIDGDRVYALGPKGQLVAVGLADGKALWWTELDESRSNVPFYGYTTVPVPAGDSVLVLTGGKGHALTAFDKKTGKTRWTRHDDDVAYQTPALVKLGGREQLVAVTNQWVRGLDPKTGDELWSFRHSEGEARNESAHPTPAGPDRVLVDLNDESLMLKVEGSKAAGFTATELWRGRAFANTLALPVYHDGTLYGFTGSVLLAVDAATGEMKWRTRDVAGQNLSLTGDDLVVLGNDGAVVVAAASPDGYRERTRLAVLERGGLSNPAIAGNRILVRNLTEMASVKVDASTRAVAAAPEVSAPRGEFGAFVASLAAVPTGERQAKVDAHLAGKSLPLIEENGIVHLVYRGAAEDVGAVGSLNADGTEVGLEKVEGTDLFYAGLELDPAGHYEYAFVVDFSQPVPDPANPNSVEDFGTTSEVRMPGWRVNEAIADPPADSPRGTLDKFQFKSEALGNTREIQVWLPPGYAQGGEATHPLVVYNYGDRELKAGKAANILDNLTAAKKIEPPIAVFVPRVAGAEYLGDKLDPYVKFLGEELVPHLERHYRIAKEVEKRAILGIGSAGFAAVYATFARPGTFGKVAAQTFYLPAAIHDAAAKTIQDSAATPTLVWLERSPYDYDQDPNNSLKDAPWLVETLRGKGIEVREDAVRGRPEWGAWRGQKDLILQALAPPAPPSQG